MWWRAVVRMMPTVLSTPVSPTWHPPVWTSRGAGDWGMLRGSNFDFSWDIRCRDNKWVYRVMNRNSRNKIARMGSIIILEMMFHTKVCTCSKCFMRSTTNSAQTIRASAPVVAGGVGPLNYFVMIVTIYIWSLNTCRTQWLHSWLLGSWRLTWYFLTSWSGNG